MILFPPVESFTNLRRVYYLGELIYDDTFTGSAIGLASYGDYFVTTTATSTSLLFYKGELIDTVNSPALVDPLVYCNDYLVLLADGTSNKAKVWYKGELIYTGPYYGTEMCGSDNLVIAASGGNEHLAWHDGEVLYQGPSEYSLGCDDYILWLPFDEVIVTGYYKGEEFYSGPQVIDYMMCCGDKLAIAPTRTSTLVFIGGEQEDYEQEIAKGYQCCGSWLYFVDTESETIDVFDTEFGKMKFDINTFERLA